MTKKGHRGMTTEQASIKKIAGHLTEHDFAGLIDGEVNKGNQQAKKDVVDARHGTHSVKSGKKWQMFLYARSRLASNTILQTIGNVAPLMVKCIDAFPDNFDIYQKDKVSYKTSLQKPMKALRDELRKPDIRKAFFSKAVFNASEVDYLTIKDSQDTFHIFPSAVVIDELCKLRVENSRKTNDVRTMDAQKVVFKDESTIGEIEMRNDSPQHFKEVKFWINAIKFLNLLKEAMGDNYEKRDGWSDKEKGLVKKDGLVVYGKAIKTFKPVI